MNKTIVGREAAERAVTRGIMWLDANVNNWRRRIDVASLDLQRPCECVLGQLDGDFYEAVWRRNLTKDEARTYGFAAGTEITYRTLTAAWKRALAAEAK